MAVEEVAKDLPLAAIWLSTSAALVALVGLLVGRDGAVRSAADKSYKLNFARLNELLSRAPRVMQALELPRGVVYNVIRDEDELKEVHRLAGQARRPGWLSNINDWLTRVVVLVVVMHWAGGVLAIWRNLDGAAAWTAWFAATTVAAGILFTKASIYLLRGQDRGGP